MRCLLPGTRGYYQDKQSCLFRPLNSPISLISSTRLRNQESATRSKLVLHLSFEAIADVYCDEDQTRLHFDWRCGKRGILQSQEQDKFLKPVDHFSYKYHCSYLGVHWSMQHSTIFMIHFLETDGAAATAPPTTNEILLISVVGQQWKIRKSNLHSWFVERNGRNCILELFLSCFILVCILEVKFEMKQGLL